MFNKYLKTDSRVFCGLISALLNKFSALLNKKRMEITTWFVANKTQKQLHHNLMTYYCIIELFNFVDKGKTKSNYQELENSDLI